MIKTWPVILKDFVNSRTIELCNKFLPRDREYVRLKKEFSRALEQLDAGLTPEANQLFLNYESAETQMESRKGDLLYQQGLFDGLRLGRLIDRTGRGIGRG
ncbi:MAG: hypothetical protein PVH64_01070 [Bacillota bacterium]|jgi:hypothetical protein